ncbi:MAG: class I SAM-dependent methyltransferase [Chloroflexota bacterium]
MGGDGGRGGLESVRRSFDSIADAYAQEFRDELSRKPLDRALLEAFAAGMPTGGSVLDLGCGAGGHIGRFVHDRGPSVTGVDFSDASIEIARRLNPDMSFVVADFRAMPFGDSSVDGIVAFYCLIYGGDEDVLGALRQCRRVLRPGGRLLAAVHGAIDGAAREGHFDDFHGIPVDVTMRETTPALFAGLAEAAGLRVDELRARDPYPEEHATRRIYLTASRPA